MKIIRDGSARIIGAILTLSEFQEIKHYQPRLLQNIKTNARNGEIEIFASALRIDTIDNFLSME